MYALKTEIIPSLVKEEFKPKAFNEVIACTKPISIKAGKMLGYAGLYESPESIPTQCTAEGDQAQEPRKDSKHQLHFEIFSNDTARINQFLDNAVNLYYILYHIKNVIVSNSL